MVLGVLLPDHQAIADTIGDGVDANDVPFNTAFPYVAYPTLGFGRGPALTIAAGARPDPWAGPSHHRPARSAR